MSEGDSAPTIRATKLSYRCIVGSYYALLVLFLINSLSALDQFSPAIPVIWLLQSAPLLGFSRAIHRKNAKQLIWLSLVVLLYFMHLKFDSKLFSLMFYIGLVLAVGCYAVFLATLHFFQS